MALASYGEPAMAGLIADRIAHLGDGRIVASQIDWEALAPARAPGSEPTRRHADLAASVQRRLEDVLLDLLGWLHERTGRRGLAMAGGVALNCVANSRIAREGPFEDVWVQPASGDAGTALGGALQTAVDLGEKVEPMPGADLGRGWSDGELARILDDAPGRHGHEPARVRGGRPDDGAPGSGGRAAARPRRPCLRRSGRGRRGGRPP